MRLKFFQKFPLLPSSCFPHRQLQIQAWVGAETIPGNLQHIQKWRIWGKFHQRLHGPYSTTPILFLATLTILGWVIFELKTSWLQAHLLHALAAQLTYQVQPGPALRSITPSSGPLDKARGYSQLPDILSILSGKGYTVQAQAQPSAELQSITRLGISPIYKEKTQSGLHIVDSHGHTLFHHTAPNRVFSDFEAIPPILVHTLLFIENRELLDPCCPYANPALEWDRLGQAFLTQGLQLFDGTLSAPGGSTLATQLEKLRHSPDGKTTSLLEKAKQVTAASLRIYQESPYTQNAQKQVILDYLNSFPLGAYPGFGEIHGFGDGLWAWFQMDLTRFNQALQDANLPSWDSQALAAATYKKGVSLLLALRRPSYYMTHIEDLNNKTDAYLRLLAHAGILSPAIRDLALLYPLTFVSSSSHVSNRVSFQNHKAQNFLRLRLQKLLEIPNLYSLDHLDLSVETTLNKNLQDDATKLLRNLSDPVFVTASHLNRPHLLDRGDPQKIMYSLTLYERTPQGNLLRAHTDTLNQPFDLNQSSKTDLGSTAKLRTLITYLEVIEQLHRRYAGRSPQELLEFRGQVLDPLSAWTLNYLQKSADDSLGGMLEQALNRRYSANPTEQFWTGGGLHTFTNFSASDNRKTFTVRQAFQHSVNLVFIRLMRDLVQYHTFAIPGSTAIIFQDPLHPRRQHYLHTFARQEGRLFLYRFYDKYKGRTPEEAWQLIRNQMRLTPLRLAVLWRSIEPDQDLQAFTTALHQAFPAFQLSAKQANRLFVQLNPRILSLADRGYAARIHPLELWTVAYLRQHPNASKSELAKAGEAELVKVYAWLFKTQRKAAQDQRIRLILEQEAFLEIHKSWKRTGYPFATLVPSLATAIGSSADRPAALTDLVGILVNDGRRIPAEMIRQLRFAEGTPFETLVTPQELRPTQILNPLIAQVLRRELIGVVEHGTAIGVKGAFTPTEHMVVSIGGKTGTGDHRQKIYERGYRLVESRPISRTATFIFLIDTHFFGAITAQVSGPRSGDYTFTSSLPVQIFGLFAPHLQAYMMSSALEAKVSHHFHPQT